MYHNVHLDGVTDTKRRIDAPSGVGVLERGYIGEREGKEKEGGKKEEWEGGREIERKYTCTCTCT